MDQRKAAAIAVLAATLAAGHVSGRLAVPSMPTELRPISIFWVDGEPGKPARYRLLFDLKVGSARARPEIYCDADGSAPRLTAGQPIDTPAAKTICAEIARAGAAVNTAAADLASQFAAAPPRPPNQ